MEKIRICFEVLIMKYEIFLLASFKTAIKIDIEEPVNGLLCEIDVNNQSVFFYGNVLTTKDRWADWSVLKYLDSVLEQVKTIQELVGKLFLVAGDFNFRLGKNYTNDRYIYNRFGYLQVKQLVNKEGIKWPTAEENTTVQQVLHSNNLQVNYSIDETIKNEKWSDHPFLKVELSYL